MKIYPTIFIAIRSCIYITLGIGALVWWVPSMIADFSPGPLFILGLPVIFAGLAIYLWTSWEFVSKGQGTPLPVDPPQILVVQGLYRVVRNPMAIGFILMLLGEAIAFNSKGILIYASALLVAIHLFVVYVEEPNLKIRFGKSYAEYCKCVPRWIPRISAVKGKGREMQP